MDATAFFGFVEKVLIHFEERGKVKMSINHLRGNSSFRSSNSSSGSSSFRSYSWYQFKCIWRVLIRTLINRTELTSNEHEKTQFQHFNFSESPCWCSCSSSWFAILRRFVCMFVYLKFKCVVYFSSCPLKCKSNSSWALCFSLSVYYFTKISNRKKREQKDATTIYID